MAYAKYVIAKVGAMTQDIAVYTEFPANWQYFFNQPTMVPDSPGNVDKVQTVRQLSRRRGPNDPNPITVRAHERFYARYPKVKGTARPGYTIRIGEPQTVGLSPYRELRQFSVKGNLMDLWAYAEAKAKMKIILWGPNGWREEIPAATGSTALHTLLVKSGTAAPAPAAP